MSRIAACSGRQVEQARFLTGLAQGGLQRLVLAVVVAAELQPAVEAAVVVQQHAAGARVDHEGAAGDVARRVEAAVEAPVRARDERGDGVAVAALRLVGRVVREQRVVQGLSCCIHGPA